jgi:hypothetical protein
MIWSTGERNRIGAGGHGVRNLRGGQVGADRGAEGWPQVLTVCHLGGGWFVAQVDAGLVMMDRETLVRILRRRGDDALGRPAPGGA